ncbi:PREDICTED: ubiquitin carboxyl-terminal hydrolase 8-like isoform X1 [Acropora digitifera]|uniref:ubiquitin carboxyl-terminal hydrolase 8-like isoform X1 n=1 Tax=Acropora digitifera TaxID=70779 RepID=UPI00077A4D89|nr:PREDICTED: ubiquitin carboxyl-terminal hydrolase 8-like isoform X1 [Acropora digitifera]
MPSPEKTLKALHLATNLEHLNKLADLKSGNRNANPQILVKSADKVYLQAQNHYLEGDEESAYVFYMRYFNLITLIKKSSKYKETQKFYDDLLGKSKIINSIEHAEALQSSLSKRYEKLHAEKTAKAKAQEEVRKKEDEDKKKSEMSKKDADSDSGFDSDLDSLLNGNGISSAVDVYQKLKVNHSSILVPKSSENTAEGTPFTEPETKPNVANSGLVAFVSAQDLYDMLKGENMCKVLVIDCRPHSVFEENNINFPSCINIPSELLDSGVSAGSIERRLNEDTRQIWNRRGEKEFVVLMDESTKVNDITPECRIQRLKDVIFKFDSNSSLKREPLILDGGFHSWLWHYPSVALKPELPKVIPQSTVVNHSSVDLSNLDYPELPEERTPPTEPQISQAPESVTHNNIPLHQIHPLNGIEKNHGSFVSPIHGIETTKMPQANTLGPLNSNALISGTTPTAASQDAISPRSANLLHNLDKPAPVQKFEPPPAIPLQPVSQNGGVPFPRPSNVTPPVSTIPASSQSVPPSGKRPSPQFGPAGLSYTEGSGSQAISTNSSGIPTQGSVPSTTAPHPAHQQVNQPGNRSVSVSQMISPFPSSSVQATSVGSQTVSSTGALSSSSLGAQPAQPGIPTARPLALQTTTPFQNQSAHNGSSYTMSRSGSTVPSVPGAQPVIVQSSFPATSLAPNVLPATSTPLLPAPSSTGPQPPSQQLGPSQSGNNSAPSVPVQSSHQSVQHLPPGQQGHSINPIPHGGEEIPKQSITLATQLPKAVSPTGPTTEPRSNQHEPQTPLNVSQATPHQNIPGKSPNSQVLPGNSAKPPVRKLSQPSDQHKKPNQPSVSNKKSNYFTTPGLPPGWEKVDDGEKLYFKDHNTQTTHWEMPKVVTTSSNVSTPRASVPQKDQSQMKRQSSVERPKLHRSLSSPNIAKLLDQRSSGPKKPVVDRMSKPDYEHAAPGRPTINRSAKPLSANQLDGLYPSHGGIGPALTGLRNLGNTCYMNSVVQCLSSVTPLSAFFISGVFREDINRTNRDGTRGELAEIFSVLVRVLHSGQFKCVSPNEFKRTIGKFKSQFSGYDQQDSQELLAFLMDGLHEDLNKVKQKPYLKAPSDDLDPETAAKIAWENHKMRNASIMVELFDGLFMSTVKCIVCGKESRKFDAFSNLTLPLPSHTNRCTLWVSTKETSIKSYDKGWYYYRDC